MKIRTSVSCSLLFIFTFVFGQDTTPPVITVPANSISISCSSTDVISQLTAWYNTAGGAVAVDNSGGPITFFGYPNLQTTISIFNASEDSLCGRTKNVAVVFFAEDASGNISIDSTLASFNTFDNTQPFLTISPSASNAPCSVSSQDSLVRWIKNHAGARASDGCSDTINWTNFVYTTSTNVTGQSSIDNGPYPIIPTNVCDWSINVVFIFQDECGNIAGTANRIFEIHDKTAPVLSSLPQNITVACDQVPLNPNLTAIDACSGLTAVLFTQTSTQGSDPLNCNHYNYSITRTWSVQDLCNNKFTHTQTISVKDDSKPVVNFNGFHSVECSSSNNPDSLFNNLSDNCSKVFVNFSDSIIRQELCSKEVIRKYILSDVCSNFTEASQILLIVDKLAPTISVTAKDKEVNCTNASTFRSDFDAWVNAKAESNAMDGCGMTNYFAAQPNSYNINDVSTFPGTPPALNIMQCGASLPTVLGEQAVDFVYYDNCGHANFTRAYFKVIDNSAPQILNCPQEIVRNISSSDCSTDITLDVPKVNDNCTATESPIVRTAFAQIKSQDPGNNIVVVDSFMVSFDNYEPAKYNIIGNGLLTIELKNTDGDDVLEFFEIYDENGHYLGRTNTTTGQCQGSITDINNIAIDTIQKWIANGNFKLKFVPAKGGVGVAGINDVCGNSRLEATLSFPIDQGNIVKSFFTIQGSNDTTEVTNLSKITRHIPTAGIYKSTFIFKDCGQNTSLCQVNINIRDIVPPTLACNNDTVAFFRTNSCNSEINLPIDINVQDNCLLPILMEATQPNGVNQLITFKYLESPNLHIANSKIVIFNNLQKINYSNSNVSLEVKIIGDLNDGTEYFDIIDENGSLVGRTNRIANKCGESVTNFTISKAKYNQWANNGNTALTAIANNDTSEEGMGINPCINLNPNENTDGISKLIMKLSIFDASIQYQVDQNPQKPLTNNSIIETFTAGSHVINFTAKDAYGNEASCSSTIILNDTISPKANCKNHIARIHPSGLIDYVVKLDSVNNHSIDNCAIDSMWLENHSYNCTDIGTEKNLKLFVKDIWGNTASCNAIIKIEKTILHPSFVAGLCMGDTIQLFANIPPPDTNNVYQYEWYKGSDLISTEPSPVLISNGSNNGLYKVIVRGFNNCETEGLIQISITTLAKPEITLDRNSYCADEEFLLNATEYSGNVKYTWYEGFPPNGTYLGKTATKVFPLKPSIGIHNYYVEVNNENCISSPSSTKKITISAKPIASVTKPFQTICEDFPIEIETTSGGQNYIYKWTGPSMFGSDLKNPNDIANAKPQNEGIYKLVINVGECYSDTSEIKVSVLPKPIKPEITGESIYCEGSTVTLSVNNVSVFDKLTWVIQGTSFAKVTNDGTIEIVNVNQSHAGNWKVLAEYNGCKSDSSNTFLIEVDQKLNIGASNDGPYCEDDTIRIYATAVPNAKYEWQSSPNFKASGQEVFTIAKAGEYFVTVTSGSGCTNTASTIVEVNKAPVIAALSNNSFSCMDGKTSIEFFPTIVPDGIYEYEWKLNGVKIFNGKNLKIDNANNTNNGSYVFTVINKKCRSKSDTSKVNVQLIPPKPTFNVPDKICEGEKLTITSNATADSFIWVTPIGIYQTASNSFEILNIKKENGGNYSLITSKSGCRSLEQDSKTITVITKPATPSIIGNQDVCFADSIVLSLSTTDFNFATWQLPDGKLVTSNILLLKEVDKDAQGLYLARITKDGCLSDFSQPFSINIKDKIHEIQFLDQDFKFCSNENKAIDLCIDINATGPNESYVISNGSGMILSDQSLLCKSIESNSLQNGPNYFFIQRKIDGCLSAKSNAAIVVKSIAPNIKAKAMKESFTICDVNDVISLESIDGPPNVDVNWLSLTPGVQIVSPQSKNSLASNFQQGKNFIALFYSKDGCENFSSDTVSISLFNAPNTSDDEFIFDYGKPQIVNFLDNDSYPGSLEVAISDSPNFDIQEENGSYTFAPKLGFAGTEILTYKVCVDQCQNLCDESTITLHVGLNIDCIPPTIFTPNQDGINDEFVIPCLYTGKYLENELYIFNQWGDEVFHAAPYMNDWQGTFNGSPLPVGTYYFVFTAKKGTEPINNFLIIQR